MRCQREGSVRLLSLPTCGHGFCERCQERMSNGCSITCSVCGTVNVCTRAAVAKAGEVAARK